MKLLFLAGREPSYVRNAIILKCLEKNRVELIRCTDSSATYPVRLVKVVFKFLARGRAACDAVFLGFLGQPLVPLVAGLSRRPIVLDAFLSTYDTMCFDRKRFRPGSLAGRFFYELDRGACRLAQRVLLDTDAHIDYFVATFGLPRDKFRRVLVGADEELFHPREAEPVPGRFRVLYCSSYLPLHGCEWIVRAAALLRQRSGLEFVLVGEGRERRRVQRLARELGADNVGFVDWLPYEQLPNEIARADLCLGGHFSDSAKAGRVIAGKTFQFIAMGKPVILGDGPGNRELFRDRDNALLVPVADAGALARAIVEMQEDAALRQRLAEAGYRTFLASGSTGAVARQLQAALAGFEAERHEA